MGDPDAKTHRRRIDPGFVMRPALSQGLTRIQLKIDQPLRRRAVCLMLDLDRGGDAGIPGRQVTAMPFINASECPGNDQRAAIRFRTGFVRLHRVVAQSTQLLRNRVRQDECGSPRDRSGAAGRRHARLTAVQGKTEARVESNGPCRRGEPADDDQIGMRRLASVGVRASPDPGEKQEPQDGDQQRAHRGVFQRLHSLGGNRHSERTACARITVVPRRPTLPRGDRERAIAHYSELAAQFREWAESESNEDARAGLLDMD